MLDKYDAKETEKRLAALWKKSRVYEFDPEAIKVFSIDTPPPTVSGDLHTGHLYSYSHPDFIARYKRMNGFCVFYPFGLDDNGLATELLVEKENNVTAEYVGREKFIELVHNTVKKYEEKYQQIWISYGLSIDWSLLYTTIGEDARKASQLSFADLYSMGRVYRKETPTLWCPKEKTAVSQMELEDKEEKSMFYYIQFSDNVLIATTRPELLSACVAIFVNPKDEKNSKLIGKKVRVPLFENEVRVYGDVKVEPSKGTGVVMCCTFGDQTDLDWYMAYGLDLKIAIDEEGRMLLGKYNGMKTKDAREAIVDDLRKGGHIVKEQEITHTVNVHERCKTEIEFVMKKQWYIRYLDLKGKLLELGNRLKWHPEHMHQRYNNWVEGSQWDWNISRQRFYGIPLPVWYCKKCDEPLIADKTMLPVNPLSFTPKATCKKCGSTEFVPESDVMDTWATSSLTPLINCRWALDGKYMRNVYPMSMRPQAHDIVHRWLFTTVLKCYLHTKELPWSDAMISGFGLDPQGRKMSKSLGNIVAAEDAIQKYSADAVRYWAATSVLGEDATFQEKDIKSGQRIANKMWNVAKFIDQNCREFGGGQPKEIDKWITARSLLALKEATEYFDNYNYAGAKRVAEEFFWFFSDNYLEFIKYRIYGKDSSANATLGHVFLLTIKLFAPFMPFITEEIYQNLFKGKLDKAESIHTSTWPTFDEKWIDNKSLEEGDLVQKVIEFIRQWKHNNKMALNAELKELVIDKDLGDLAEDVKGAMNIKKITKGSGSLQIPGTDIAITL